jgi:proline dehydrogenase
MISFDNTEYAFEYKSSNELKKANFLFSCMGKPWMVNAGLSIMPSAIKFKIPFTKSIIRNTIFEQFVGGETLEDTMGVAEKLGKYNVDVILDYGVEGGEEDDSAFNHAKDEFIKVIKYASTQPNIPFISIKVTGIVSFALMQKLDSAMQKLEGTLQERYQNALAILSPTEKIDWTFLMTRLDQICKVAAEKNIGVLVDAEETWIQDPVDAITMQMMERYNRQKAIVYNTIQLYRHDRLAFLKTSFGTAAERNFLLAVKIVRGAYMEKERKRASDNNYPSPIQPNKESSDKDYNAAVEFVVDNIEKIAVIVASHNEQSNLYATQLLDKKGLPHKHKHVHFSQLYGMSDNITFNLAKSGCSVSKYLPFGPIEDVIPYLMRRAQENSSVSGQMGRELGLIKKELARRKIK